MIEAVVFDLDGVLIDSEELWDAVRRGVVAAQGGRWREEATRAMQGMSAPEWGRYLRESLAVDLPVDRIVSLVVDELLDGYRHNLPLLPGAVAAVRRVGRRWPLGLASSANRVVIDAVLPAAELSDAFAATVSSEEVARGKPAPDVYLEAARRLGVTPSACAAVEDSANGIRSAAAAGLVVIAVPNRQYPPGGDALAEAAVVLRGLDGLTEDVIEGLEGGEAFS